MQRVMMSAAALAIGVLAGGVSAAKCPFATDGDQGSYHPNGGGWVHHTARVAETAYVGPSVIVCHRAEVSGNADIRGNSRIFGTTVVSGNAIIRDADVLHSARVDGNARVIQGKGNHWVIVSGNAHVYGNAHVTGNALVTDNARVYGSAKVGRSGGASLSDARFVQIHGEVFGSAVVRGNGIIWGDGKVNCGRWNINVTTDHTGECGRNGKKAKILTLPDLPGINPANTETAE